MTRFSILALTAIVAIGGAAAPAFAAPSPALDKVPYCSADTGPVLDAQKDTLAQELRLSTSGGSIDVWNGCFKVMTTVNGKTNVAFYDPDSLKLIGTLG